MAIELKRYSKKQLMDKLGISSYDAYNKAIDKIKDELGEYILGRYNERQVERICKHLGEVIIYPEQWPKDTIR